MIKFIEAHKELALWFTIISALFFFLSLSVIPFLLVRIPPHYFLQNRTNVRKSRKEFRSLKFCFMVLKNLFGVILLLCGIAMLVLPGQGILTILLSMVFLDFPGKQKFEYWLISRPMVLKTVNKMRKKANRQPLNISKK